MPLVTIVTNGYHKNAVSLHCGMKKQLHATVIKSKCVTKNERKHYE